MGEPLQLLVCHRVGNHTSLKLSADNHIAVAGGAYEFAKLASANLREKDDPYNTLIGGMVGGAFIGLRR